MTIISLIAAIDEHRGLGKENKLLCHLPADLRHFKDLTIGKPVIMGRKTYESIGKALPGRLNIVLSKKHAFNLEDATVVNSLSQAIALTTDSPEVMIIGGAQLFQQALPIAQRAYLTLIHAQFDADVFFPELNEKQWHCSKSVSRMSDEKNKYDMTFYYYEHCSVT